MEQSGGEEVAQESVVSPSRVNILSRPSRQSTGGAIRSRSDARLPETSHRTRRRGSKRDVEDVGSNGQCKKSCTSNERSEVPVPLTESSNPQVVHSDSAAEGSSSEVDSASVSSAIQDHSYSMVNDLRPLESSESDLRVTEHSYSLASIGALEAPSTQQLPPAFRRSSRLSTRLLNTTGRARTLSRGELEESVSIPNPNQFSARLLNTASRSARNLSREEPMGSVSVTNPSRLSARLMTSARRARILYREESARRSARLMTMANRRARNLPREESTESILMSTPRRQISRLTVADSGGRTQESVEMISSTNPSGDHSQSEERPVVAGGIQEVGGAELPVEMETVGTNPVRPTEPPALTAMADGTDHLRESLLTSSLDFIRSHSRDREDRQRRDRSSSSHRRSARSANTRRMHATRRPPLPDQQRPPTLPHVLPLPRAMTIHHHHPLAYTHIAQLPMSLQLFRQSQADPIQRAVSVLYPSPPSLEPLSSQPTSSVLSRTAPEGTQEAASGINDIHSDAEQASDLAQGSDEIQMWSEDSMDVPLQSQQEHHSHRNGRDVPHLRYRTRRNAQPSILSDISEADLRSLRSHAPQSPEVGRWHHTPAPAVPASTGGANAAIDVVVVDSDSEEETDRDVIIIGDEGSSAESNNRPGSHAAGDGNVNSSRTSRHSLINSDSRTRERVTRRFMEMGLREPNPIFHLSSDGSIRRELMRNGREPHRRGRTLLVNASPSVVPRVAEEEEVDSEIVFEVPHPQGWRNILVGPRSEQQFVRRPSRFPPPPVLWYPTLGSRFHTFEELLDLADDLGPARSHGLTQDDINKLDVRCFGDWDSDSAIDSKCVVCLSEYQRPEKVRTLTCSHMFHQTCIDQWLLGHRTCPICRVHVTPS